MATAEGLRSFCCISLADCRRGEVVKARRRAARRSRILGVEVSGMERNMRTRTGAEIHTISQRDQRQPLTGTAKPERSGPSAGPQNAADTQKVIA